MVRLKYLIPTVMLAIAVCIISSVACPTYSLAMTVGTVERVFEIVNDAMPYLPFGDTFGDTFGGILPGADIRAPFPLPAALPLFASGLGVLGLLGWRRKRKNAAA
jgi:hypothetical protein